MKKKILSLILIVIFAVLFSRFYYYYLFDKNSIVIIYHPELPTSYEESAKYMEIEFYIDDRLIYSTDSLIMYYNSIESKTPWGIHVFKMKINSKIVEETTFFTFPVKWILVEIIDENNLDVQFSYWKPRFN